MVFVVTNVNLTVRSGFPLGNVIVVCKVLFEDLFWTAKHSKIGKMMRWCLSGKEFIWTLVVMVSYWSHVVELNSMFDHKSPEVSSDDLGPEIHCM